MTFVETTAHSVQRFASAFTACYATLTEEQRLQVDDWFAHSYSHHGLQP